MNAPKKKRINACAFCRSWSCYTQIVCTVPGYLYDEIACDDHRSDLEAHANKTIPRGIPRHHRAASYKLSRLRPGETRYG